jgi:hypothetical protein
MTGNHRTRDLIVLAADSQIKSTVETLLNFRHPSLGIREISFEVQTHPHQDSGCRTGSEGMLRPLLDEFERGMLVFDYDGCGERDLIPEDLEISLESRYVASGFNVGRVSCVVINPELEVWMFGASFHRLQEIIGWSQPQSIRDWLVANGYLCDGSRKPIDPKAAIEAVLNVQKVPKSRRLFANLARRVSLAHCEDRAFQKFRSTLQRWFPA